MAFQNRQGNLNRKWRVSLGKGYSGPVVSQNLVFTTESVDEYELTHAYNREDGKLVWQTQWEGKMKVPFLLRKMVVGFAQPPTFDGNSLFVCGMRDVLHSLDAETGKVHWKVDFTERYKTPLPAFGTVCSPLVDGDNLYVQAGAGFVKLNKNSGDSLWHSLKDKGGMFGSAFSSPVIEEINGNRQVIVQSSAPT